MFGNLLQGVTYYKVVKDMDFTAIATAMGATVNTKTVTELIFGPGRKVLLEELSDMDPRAAVQKLLSIAFPNPGVR